MSGLSVSGIASGIDSIALSAKWSRSDRSIAQQPAHRREEAERVI